MTNFGGVSGDKLRQLVDKIEKLEEEKKEVAECIRDAYGEAKSYGYDVKILKKVIKLRTIEAAKRMEEEEILDIYMHALGMGVEPSSTQENDINEALQTSEKSDSEEEAA